ncbi:MAG: hypothetical protein KC590_06645, partial [Nitrospira sp.]|nr:hypothetical protein [Nitrospira sp.]
MNQRITFSTPLLISMPLLLGALLTGCETMQKLVSTPKPQGLNTRVYSANESSNTVTVMDGDTYQVLGEIDTLNY